MIVVVRLGNQLLKHINFGFGGPVYGDIFFCSGYRGIKDVFCDEINHVLRNDNSNIIIFKALRFMNGDGVRGLKRDLFDVSLMAAPASFINDDDHIMLAVFLDHFVIGRSVDWFV